MSGHYRKRIGVTLMCLSALVGNVAACIWDSDTLSSEIDAKPDLARIIMEPVVPVIDTPALEQRLTELLKHPKEDDPTWWNERAGALIRLGRSQEAIEILEPCVEKFSDNYGIHANLGTAYHLAGRYAEAERHIARDLEINPNAHFGLERFHLALLQYLTSTESNRIDRVYIEEFTSTFQRAQIFSFRPDDQELLRSYYDELPGYTDRWDLGADPKLAEGLIYMASLNQQEPAVFVMLGMLCLYQEDLNLAALAFERAVELGSPQEKRLTAYIQRINKHIAEARRHHFTNEYGSYIAVGVVVVCLSLALLFKLKRRSCV